MISLSLFIWSSTLLSRRKKNGFIFFSRIELKMTKLTLKTLATITKKPSVDELDRISLVENISLTNTIHDLLNELNQYGTMVNECSKKKSSLIEKLQNEFDQINGNWKEPNTDAERFLASKTSDQYWIFKSIGTILAITKDASNDTVRYARIIPMAKRRCKLNNRFRFVTLHKTLLHTGQA